MESENASPRKLVMAVNVSCVSSFRFTSMAVLSCSLRRNMAISADSMCSFTCRRKGQVSVKIWRRNTHLGIPAAQVLVHHVADVLDLGLRHIHRDGAAAGRR